MESIIVLKHQRGGDWWYKDKKESSLERSNFQQIKSAQTYQQLIRDILIWVHNQKRWLLEEGIISIETNAPRNLTGLRT